MCRFATISVQPATRSTQHATPISLHIRQAHCYIARLGNISNPRKGGVLQLVRARCVSIKCVPIELAEQGYNTLSRVLNGPTFRSRSQTLASLQRNARDSPAREGQGRREPRNARFGLARVNAESASPARQGTPKQLGANSKERESARTFGSIIFRYRTWIPLVVK